MADTTPPKKPSASRDQQYAAAAAMKHHVAADAQRSLDALARVEDEPGRASRVLAGQIASVACVVAALAFLVIPVLRHKQPHFVTAFVLLIVPMAIGLETASARQYHRYRAALQAMIQGRMDQQAAAAKRAAEEKKAAELKKAAEEAKKAKQADEAANAWVGAEDAEPGRTEKETLASAIEAGRKAYDEARRKIRSGTSAVETPAEKTEPTDPAKEISRLTIEQLFPHRKIDPSDSGTGGSEG
jgi:hypothetical protein